jgi:hypothetical protein
VEKNSDFKRRLISSSAITTTGSIILPFELKQINK